MGYKQHYYSILIKNSQKFLSHIKLDITIMFLKNHTFKYFKDGKFKVIRENSSCYFIINKKMLLYYLWDDDPDYDFTTPIPENLK